MQTLGIDKFPSRILKPLLQFILRNILACVCNIHKVPCCCVLELHGNLIRYLSNDNEKWRGVRIWKDTHLHS